MGKKRLEKIVLKQIKNMKERIQQAVDEETQFEDDEYILKVISPNRLELTPLNMSVEELHIKCIKRMDKPLYKKLYNQFNIYISSDNKKVVMSK